MLKFRAHCKEAMIFAVSSEFNHEKISIIKLEKIMYQMLDVKHSAMHAFEKKCMDLGKNACIWEKMHEFQKFRKGWHWKMP